MDELTSKEILNGQTLIFLDLKEPQKENQMSLNYLDDNV